MKRFLLYFVLIFIFCISSCEFSTPSPESETIESITTYETIDDSAEVEIELYYGYTLDDIKNSFYDDNDLFERAKDLSEIYTFSVDRLIEYPDESFTMFLPNSDEYITLNKDSEFEPLLDILNKYEWIESISSSQDYKILQINLYSSHQAYISYYYDYEITEVSDGIYVKLNDDWYLYYSNFIKPSY